MFLFLFSFLLAVKISLTDKPLPTDEASPARNDDSSSLAAERAAESSDDGCEQLFLEVSTEEESKALPGGRLEHEEQIICDVPLEHAVETLPDSVSARQERNIAEASGTEIDKPLPTDEAYQAGTSGDDSPPRNDDSSSLAAERAAESSDDGCEQLFP